MFVKGFFYPFGGQIKIIIMLVAETIPRVPRHYFIILD